MLAEGELDAVFHSDLIKPFLAKDPRVARLFADPKAEEMAYYKRTGIFPIMHVLGIRQALPSGTPGSRSTFTAPSMTQRRWR